MARAVQSLKARCHRQSGPLSALGTAPALELVVELPVVLAPLAGPGLSHPPISTWALVAAQANGARGPWSRAANPVGSPWAVISQWCAARRRPSSRLTTAIGPCPALADHGAGLRAASWSRLAGAKVDVGVAGAVGKRGGAAA